MDKVFHLKEGEGLRIKRGKYNNIDIILTSIKGTKRKKDAYFEISGILDIDSVKISHADELPYQVIPGCCMKIPYNHGEQLSSNRVDVHYLIDTDKYTVLKLRR